MRGAKDRVKQMLPFKLGEELIRYHKQRGGGIWIFNFTQKSLFYLTQTLQRTKRIRKNYTNFSSS